MVIGYQYSYPIRFVEFPRQKIQVQQIFFVLGKKINQNQTWQEGLYEKLPIARSWNTEEWEESQDFCVKLVIFRNLRILLEFRRRCPVETARPSPRRMRRRTSPSRPQGLSEWSPRRLCRSRQSTVSSGSLGVNRPRDAADELGRENGRPGPSGASARRTRQFSRIMPAVDHPLHNKKKI